MSITVLARGPRSAEIRIFDPIGQDFFGTGVTAKRVDDELRALGDVTEILVRINSPGGEVFDGLAIYNTLKAHAARKVVVVEGLAASIASVIAMAGDEIRMPSSAMLMIHDPWTVAVGSAEQLRKAGDSLEKIGEQLRDVYASRTGIAPARIEQIMTDETWFTAQEAVDLGFATSVIDQEASSLTSAAVAALNNFRKTPQQVFAMTTAATRETFLAAEQTRRSTIRNLFLPDTTGAHRALLDDCLDDPECTPEAASGRFMAAIGASSAGPLAGHAVVQGSQVGSHGDFMAAAADAICMRSGIQVREPHSAARDMVNMSILDIARTCLSRTDRSASSLMPARLIKAAMTTSDFPLLLENALGKTLRAGYAADPQSHVAWVKPTQVPDFKTQSRLLLGSAPGLLAVLEAGEYQNGALDENRASLQVTKFGRLIQLSWEALVNDDLGAFLGVPQAMGAAARRAEADQVYAIFAANSGAGQAMQDSVSLFDAGAHANVSATTGAISIATLGAARTLLRKQQALGGGYLNLAPRFLIVPVESETLAEQVLASATRHAAGASVANTVSSTTTKSGTKLDSFTPEWISQLQLVVEPRLNPANGFYLAAHHSQIDTVELATLSEDGGAPVLEEDREFRRDVNSYKVRHVFVAKAIDWKGLVRVPASG